MLHKIWVYCAMMQTMLKVAITQLLRRLARQKHPKDWPAEQEMFITVMRTMFTTANYHDTRKLIEAQTGAKVPGLEVTAVPPSTFKVSGWRTSYWLELEPELRPTTPRASLVMLYLHGGGFVLGHPLMYTYTHRNWLKQLAGQGIHMRIFAVGYPLAPENPFPAGLAAVVEAYDWLTEELGGSEHIILAGDSVGGNFAITALAYMKARSQGLAGLKTAAASLLEAAAAGSGTGTAATTTFHPPQAAILISPAVDYSSSSVVHSGSSTAERFAYDYIVPGKMELAVKRYTNQVVSASDPLVSPVYLTDFTGLVRSKLLVMTGGCESLAADIDRFVAHIRVTSPQLDVVHHVEPNEPHCYPMLKFRRLREKGEKAVLPFIAGVAGAATTSS